MAYCIGTKRRIILPQNALIMKNKRTKKIQDYDRGYSLLHRYVNFTIGLSYRKIVHAGLENIPKDGAIIFAPNHTNTLMDALVILNIDHKPKVFVARADIFRNKKLAKILTFLKIMPIMRQRDGFNAVKKNQEIIDKSVDVLKDRIPFCIFPEGTHQAKYSLLPISKGIFRIAFQAHEQMPDTPLYIVPVGLRYGDLFRFRSTIHMKIGQPINVGEFISENAHLTQQEQMNSLKELFAERISSTILHIPNDENYNATYEICNAAEPVETKELLKEKSNNGKHALEIQFEAHNNTLKRIVAMKESNPEKAKKLFDLGNEASRLRKKRGIDIDSVTTDKPLMSRMTRTILTAITLPYTILSICKSRSYNLQIPFHQDERPCIQKFSKIPDKSFCMAAIRSHIFNTLFRPASMAVGNTGNSVCNALPHRCTRTVEEHQIHCFRHKTIEREKADENQ